MKIQHKRSSALESGKAKQPTAPQTEYGELCVNFNHQDPSLFIRDSADVIRKIGGDLDLYALKTEAGANVIISQTAPTVDANGNPIREGQLWWADSDVDEGGGRLYVWTGDEWVDTSLPGVGGGDSLTVDQADGLYLSKTVDDTAEGAITFKGLTTHETGVKVTAGSIDVQSNVSITGSSFISGAPQAAIRLGDNQGNNSDIGSWTNLIANTGKLQVVSRQDSSGGGSWWEFQMEPGNCKKYVSICWRA